MAQKTYTLNVDVNAPSVGQLEAQLEQVNQELKNLDRNSDAFKAAAKDAQALNKEISKMNGEIEGFTLDKKIQAADGAAKVFAGSLASAVGTLGVLGIESEVFGEFEEKAASAIAVGIGIKDVAEGAGQLTTAFKESGIAAKIMGVTTKQALIATGIGIFVVALGTMVAYWDEIVEGVENFGKKVPIVGKAIEFIKQQFDNLVDAFRPVLEFLGIMPTEAEAAMEALRQGAEDSIGPLERQLDLMKASGATAEELYQKEKELAEARVTAAKDEEERLEAQHELALIVATEQKRLADEEKGRIEELKIKRKEALDEQKANELEALQFLEGLQQTELDLLAQTDEEKLALAHQRTLDEIEQLKVDEETKNQIRLQAEENYQIQKQQLADENNQSEKEQLEANQQELRDIMQAYDLASIEDAFERAKEELRIEEEKEIARLELLGASEEEIARVKQFYANKQNEIATAQKDWEVMTAQQKAAMLVDAAAQTFGNLSQILGEESKAGKAAAIAETVIRTYQSAQSAYASMAAIPIVGPALGAVAAAAAVAAGIANVKKIKSTPVPGGGGSGGPSVSAANIPQPPTPPQEQAPVATAQTFDTQPAVQAYVVAGDTTSAQEAEAKINKRRDVTG